ncbi:MAG TPA: DNA gyrase modulator, partial [bacterium]
MLPDTTVRKVLDLGVSHGADFAEVFVEDSESSSIDLLDKKIDSINSGNSFGVGVRLLFGDEAYYGYSSDIAEAALLGLTENLAQSRKDHKQGQANPFKQ